MATTKVSLAKDSRKRHPWVVRWFGEYDPGTDQQRRYSKSFERKRDAEAFQTEKQSEFNKGAKRDRPENITLGDFCKLYMERRNHEWREKTRLHIANQCKRLIECLGAKIRLQSLTPDKVSRFWSKSGSARRDGNDRELSKYTRNRILRECKTMFRFAVDWEIITKNPFAHLKQLRIGKKSRFEWRFIQPDEYRALLDHAPDMRWKVFYALAYTTGARFGELFNLTEDCIDLENGRVFIRNRLGTDKLPPFEVKDDEDRVIPIPMHVVELLEQWLSSRPTGSPLLLVSPDRFELILQRWTKYRQSGKPWLNDYLMNNVRREIRRHAREANIKDYDKITVHCFRKSCGQNWADGLPMNVVKEFMGHADISTTNQFYSKVTEDHEIHAQWVMEKLYTGDEGNTTDARLTPEAKFTSNRKVG